MMEMMIDLNLFFDVSGLCADCADSTGDELLLGPGQLRRGRRLQLPRQRNKKGWTKTWELLITCWIYAIYVESWTLSDPNSLNFGLHNGLTRSIFQLCWIYVSSQRCC